GLAGAFNLEPLEHALVSSTIDVDDSGSKPASVSANLSFSPSPLLQSLLKEASSILSGISVPSSLTSTAAGAVQSPLTTPLSGLAGNTSAGTTQLLNTVLSGVTSSLSNAESSLAALSSSLAGATSGTTAAATSLLNGVIADVTSSLGTIRSDLNTLAGILPA